MAQTGQMPSELVVRGKPIAQDKHGFFCLTDMWRLSGAPEWKSAGKWRTLPTTKELLAAVNVDFRFSEVISKTPEKSGLYTRKGRGAQTFAHIILALSYSEYLDPQLGIEVREIALRFWAGDITLFDDFVRRREAQVAEDSGRVVARDKIREDNSKLQFGILHGLGARSPAQYAEFHNSGYRGLYNGEDENAIHQRKNLKADQSILDHMGYAELAANMFRTTQTEERLRNFPAVDLTNASQTHMWVGKRVREFMAEMGSRMPEDMPVADSISHAKKRLRDYDKGQKKLK